MAPLPLPLPLLLPVYNAFMSDKRVIEGLLGVRHGGGWGSRDEEKKESRRQLRRWREER